MDISAFFPPDTPSRGPISAYVRDWLLQQLDAGPQPASEVLARAAAEGISPTAMKRGRKELTRLRQIETVRQSVGNGGVGRWVLRLVDMPQADPSGASRKAAQEEPNKTSHCGDGPALGKPPEIKFFQVPEAQQPTRKTYVCTRWPRLHLSHIRFRDGRYETSNPDEQALIERADGYGVHIRQEQG